MTDLTIEAAELADIEIIARHRFVEAAETMAYLQVRGTRPSDKSGTWPGVADIVDGDYLERYRPSAAAISRAEEVMQDWLLDFVADQEQRVVACRWAASLAVPRIAGSFRSFCKKTGRNRTTADRRVNLAFQSVASGLRKLAKPLREPDWSRTGPLMPDWATDFDMVAERVAERQTAWHAPNARPTNQPEMRDTSWADDQNRRRREREEEQAA
ncbi:hypothetical protein ACLNGM_14990 [Aureimonas phyllosphaerae]|uniref:hypothetical protein n=1 Tax=Aureimonas phyllosphaerae TaxID=1166078 RepID=UPI003A5C0F1F